MSDEPDVTRTQRMDVGNTPLDEDETERLIPPHLTTRAELNQWEAANIDRAHDWIVARAHDALDVSFLQDLHRHMFDETWEWAGAFRTSDKSISPYHWTEVPRLVRDLVANIQVQYEVGERTPESLDALAVRFHHELVKIHLWPNGNGRHSRLATDLLLRQWGRPSFSWGGNAAQSGSAEARARYISALRAADAGAYEDLIHFVRS